MLSFRAAAVTYPRGRVGPFELELPDGAFVGVCGPTAAGKSVLLKLACGLVRPTEGAVIVDGVELGSAGPDALREVRGRIGMVFQNDALFDSTTVLQNVALPLLRRGVNAAEAEARARQALAEVGLTGAEEKRPAQLSGGMKKRVGVARALVAAPRLALYDDPTAGLDPATTRKILELAAQVHRQLGGVTVIAGPDPAPLWPRCTLGIALDEGSVVGVGEPRELLSRPEVAALFAAEPGAAVAR